MDWNQLKSRMKPSVIENTGRFTLPETIIEVQPGFVMGVRLASRKAKGKPAASLAASNGAAREVRHIAVGRLEPGTLRPAVNAPNVADTADLSRTLEALADSLRSRGGRPGPTGLLVPDGVVRVATLTFETLPEAPKEAQALIRWRMKENLGFPPEQARISYEVTFRDTQRVEVLAVAAKNEVLAEYESALAVVNGDSALILPATLAMLPLLPDSDETSGHLLIHWCGGWLAAAIVTGHRLRLWRTRPLGTADTESGQRELRSEVARMLASAEDHLKMEVAGVWLCARPPEVDRIGAELAAALGRDIHPLTPGAEMGAALPADDRQLFESFGAPAAGLAANGEAMG